jgi:hypothetical protein
MTKNDWEKYAKEIGRIERKYFSIFERATKAQIRAFTNTIRSEGVSFAVSQLTTQPFNEALIKPMQDLYKEAGLQGAKRVSEELKRAAGQKRIGFGQNEKWIAEILAYLSQNILNRAILPITETTRKIMLEALNKGLADGSSIDEIIAKIESDAGAEWLVRLRVRTETVKASNVGHVIGARTSPYQVDKVWIAALDHRTRHTHYNLHEVKIGELETFSNGLKFPADPDSNNPAEVCNCRCRVIYEPKRTPAGVLIMR